MSSYSSQEGVFYAKSAHPGLWRRFAIGLVDIFVAMIVMVILATIFGVLLPERSATAGTGLTWLVFVVFYFVFLKRSTFRTLGYRLFRVRVVDLHGERPSIFKMVNRFSFMLLGPFNGPIDLLWVASDDSKQALRDKWSQTYVVSDTAEPEGHGQIRMQRYGLMGFNMLFAEVEHGAG